MKKKKQKPRSRQRRRLRIIGGQWRGRRIGFPAKSELRPTPDRVRETLFNWLQSRLFGADCLDLFAGSGALGLEALSRGAQRAVFIEQDAAAVAALRANLEALGVGNAEVVQGNVLEYLGRSSRSYDVVFLDPPFIQGYLEKCCALLERYDWIKPGGLIYLEAERALRPLPVPENWALLRSKTAGQVGYHLARREGSEPKVSNSEL